MPCCPCMQACNSCVSGTLTSTRCCTCYDAPTHNVKPCCISYSGFGWSGACTAFNAVVLLSPIAGIPTCYWACHTAPILIDLQYHSAGDYWEFRLSKDDGATFTVYRLAGASFVCNSSNTFSLFAAGPCPAPPATVQLDLHLSCCALDVCDYASSPAILHASLASTCALLNNVTVTITKTVLGGRPNAWAGNKVLSNGRYLFMEHFDDDPFMTGCPYKRITFSQQTLAPPCDFALRGCCSAISAGFINPDPDCDTASCNPYFLHYTNVPIILCFAEPCHDVNGNCVNDTLCYTQVTVTQ
jgi:hypothetical protein